jgi:Methyltransferase FkbM domain
VDIKRVWNIFASCNYNVVSFASNHVVPYMARKRNVVLPKEYGQYGVSIDGVLYSLNSFNDCIFHQVEDEYNFNDIQSSDILLDVGANVGYFSLHASNKCDKIFAVEPLYINELTENIKINHFEGKMKVLPYALSLFDLDLKFNGKTGHATGKTLTELIHLCGGHIDVLKCDCEGGEWIIKPEELTGIRRIEMEVHRFNGENVNDLISKLFVNYDILVDHDDKDAVMVHAFLKKREVSP